ncbi:MAG TPA: glycosyltransferase, partial [Coriobacteriia bacterium]|nr:glycosyltransferase [Coriobacteriia bacterium]
MPRFSVIVPAYNATATVRETLDALEAQEFRDWECVVVDDGSTDDTATIISEYAERDSRFKLVQQANTGTAGAYRTGVEQARADLIVICAADD